MGKIRISDSEGKIRQSDRIKNVVYLPVPCVPEGLSLGKA